jgi:hypothetical protein
MPDGFSEPKTEAEARAIEKFLKQGAETAIEVVDSFEARAEARAVMGEPATIEFDTTVDELLRAAGESDERRVTITLELAEIEGAGEAFGEVFLNNREANAETPAEDPSFVGALAVFPHMDQHLLPDEGEGATLHYEIDVTSNLQVLALPGEALTGTIVLVPSGEGDVQSAGVLIRSAIVRIVNSVVRTPS